VAAALGLQQRLADGAPERRLRRRHRLPPVGDDGGIRAFDPATGRQLWYSQELGIGNGTEDASNVAATSGAIYFSLYENAVYGGDNALMSLDARTGAVRWRVRLGG
jgi:outer membrane protein assembly factor BamB